MLCPDRRTGDQESARPDASCGEPVFHLTREAMSDEDGVGSGSASNIDARGLHVQWLWVIVWGRGSNATLVGIVF